MSDNGTATNFHGVSPASARIRFAHRAGLQYGGKRDVYQVAGYPTEQELEGRNGFDTYWSRYQRQGIAGRIVDMPAQTTWRNAPEIVEVEREDGTAFTEAFEALRKRLRLWNRLERADRLSGIGRYGVILIGTRGIPDDGLKEPLQMMSSPEDVIYLSQFHERSADINTWVTDTGDPRFGQPNTYRIDLAGDLQGFGGTSDAVVHWSRVIHVAEDLLDDDVYGRPRLKRVMNDLYDLEKVSAATAEAFWQLADRTWVLSIDPDADISDDELKKLGEAIEDLAHDLRKQMTLQGGDLSTVGGETPDPTGPADLYMMMIAAACGIPKRILFGTETGERASEQDERQWLGAISERQERFAEPMILREFIDRLIRFGGLPEPDTGEYEVKWPNLFELSEQQQQQANSSTAAAAKALTPVGGDPYELVSATAGVLTLRDSEEVTAERDEAEDERRRMMEEGTLPTPPGMDPSAEGPEEGDGEDDEGDIEEAA